MKKTILPLLLLAALAAAAFRPVRPQEPTMTARKLTPVLIVDRVEPCVEFWTERLGFEKKFEVPHGDRLGFAAVEKGGVEIMYQSRESVAADIAALAGDEYRTALFIEVEDLDAVERALQGVELVQPRRTTFYGMMEVAVREPGGSVVIFAQPVAQPAG